MSPQHRHGVTRRALILLLALVAGGIGVAYWMRCPQPNVVQTSPTAALDPFPVAPLSPTRFLNAGSDAKYIGSAACATCHPANHNSYLETPHSKALAEVKAAAEPADGEFRQASSGRNFRVYRQDGQLHHKESLQNEKGEEIARVDVPVRLLVGSGHYTRTYVADADGFLQESPITWYASKGAWGLSPGYEAHPEVSFSRPVTRKCLACHAGGVEERDGAVHRLVFREQAIGCENCHGPGSLHRDAWRGQSPSPGKEDPTIVNPARLSRTLAESICASCHLSDPASIDVRGHSDADFRPGRPLSDYRIHYQFAGGHDQMTVVGHVEQLRQSACYRSPTMTCTTCHDPHGGKIDRPIEFYRTKCLTCHADRGCTQRLDVRGKVQNDNCVACHMPRGDTEIPHVAFTHHRIGIHRPGGDALPSMPPAELVASDDTGRLSAIDRDRNLGLAYLHVSLKPGPGAAGYRMRATSLLEAVSAAGLPDPLTDLGLAQLYWNSDPGRAVPFARAALSGGLPPLDRSLALNVMADCAFRTGDYAEAGRRFEELTRLRRTNLDWEFLAAARVKTGDLAGAASAYHQALTINPFMPATHAALADVYGKLGDDRQAQRQAEAARELARHAR